jgi:Ig-like domain CHU_C associated/Secretion system C-terminal sorting domain
VYFCKFRNEKCMKKIILSVSLLLAAAAAMAQTQFRSNGTGGGTWGTNSTWQQSADGITWVAATSTPTSASGAITVRSADVVTVSGAVTIDETTVDFGGTLSVSNATLTLANVVNALTVDGTLNVTGTGAVSSPSSTALVFNATYTHARNGGNIPTATWNINSLCNITGIGATTLTGGLSPVGGFYDFTWSCGAQSAAISLSGNLVSVRNNLTISTTNGQQLQLATNTGPTIAILGDLTITSNSRVAFVTSGTGAVIAVGGNFNYYSTNTTGSPLKTTGSYTLNVTGNFDMNATGGLLQLSGGNGNIGTMNLLGDFALSAGTLSETGNGRGAINFNKNGVQLFSNAGTISSTIDFSISPLTTLEAQGESPLGGVAASGNFTLNGILRLGSVNTIGALQTGRTAGNIMTTGTRTYNSASRVVYSGLAAQFIGSGHPTSAGVVTEIDNPSGVTFNTTTSGNTGVATIISIPDDLILTNGNLNIASSGGTVRSLTINSNITANGNNITFSGTTSDLVINGTGSLGTFPFPAGSQTFRNFTLNRTSSGAVSFTNALTITGTTTLTSGTVTFLGATALTGNVSLATGTVLAFDGQSLSMAGNFTSTGLLSASGASTLSLTGGTALISALNFSSTNKTLTSLTINKSNVGISATISSALNVTSTLTIADGQLDITGSSLTMGSPSTINLSSAGSVTTSAPAGGPWNLNYSGTANINPTGFEIPASGSLLSLSSTNTATITLDQSLTIGTGGFTLNASGGAFTAVANAISTSFLTVTVGTFTAPSSTLTLTGDISVSGTYTNNGGTLVFGGSSAQSILGTAASATNFNAVTINSNATVVAPATFNIQGSFANNGTLTAGSNTVNFSGGNVQTITGSSNTQFNNFTVNKSGGSLTVSAAQTIASNLTLTAGTLSVAAAVSVSGASSQVTLTAGTLDITTNLLSLANGATLTRAAGTITTSSPGGGPWNLIYTGASKTTGLEIPTSGNVTSVTINTNNTTTVTLNQVLNVANAFTISTTGRTFTCGANNVTVGSLSNAGTFTAPSSAAIIGLTLNGTLNNTGTFTNSTGTVVVAGAVSITGTVPTLNNLTVNLGGTFTAPPALTIQGNLQNNGSIVAGSGTITFSGNTAKQITGTTKIAFRNITVSNGTAATDLSLETTAGADITGILTMGATAVFDTDGASGNNVFTLLSTADNPTTADASIAAIGAATQLPGKITVQRYMNRQGVALYNYQVWRNISSPVNTTVADIQPELPVTGSFTGNDNTAMATTLTSMYSYDQTVITDTDGSGTADLDDGFKAFPVSLNSEAFARGQGYSIFIFGSDAPVVTNGNSKWDVRGTIWSGTFNLPVTRTPSGVGATYVAANDGWNLVGNPYPSTIDWLAAGWTKTNVDDAIYMSDYSTANPVFATFINGVGTNGGTRYIATGQGFWVKANANTIAAPVLTIQESVKVAGTQTTFFRQAAPSDLIRVTLSKDDLKDETVVYFSDSATVEFDSNYDARKFRNPYWYLNLASLSPNQEKYAINAVPFSTCARQVSLDVSDVVTGTYQLIFTEFESMSAAMKIQFKDNFTNSTIDVRQNPSYSFDVDDTNPTTFGAGRFQLIFTYDQSASLAITASAANVCDVTQAKVTIASSSVDVNYSLASPTDGSLIGSILTGNSGLLDLSIPADKLITGLNTFEVKATNKYCASLIAASPVPLQYIATPVEPSVQSGSTCGTGQATLLASGAPTDGHYIWYDSLSANVAIADAVLASFKTPVLTVSKEYYVSLVNSLGCEGPRTVVMAIVANPTAAQITSVDLFTLQSNYDTGNQWYYNGVAIAGATGKTLKVDKSGQYGLDVKVGDCTVSDKTELIVLAVEDALYKGAVKIYPNPVKEFLRVEIVTASEPKSTIFNSVGQEVGNLKFEKTGESYSANHDVKALSTGVYFLKVVKEDQVSVIRILKN